MQGPPPHSETAFCRNGDQASSMAHHAKLPALVSLFSSALLPSTFPTPTLFSTFLFFFRVPTRTWRGHTRGRLLFSGGASALRARLGGAPWLRLPSVPCRGWRLPCKAALWWRVMLRRGLSGTSPGRLRYLGRASLRREVAILMTCS